MRFKPSYRMLGIPLVRIVGAWSISGWLAYKLSDGVEKAGQFGDMFGAINALFSGMAFAGIIYTILLQRRELALQREELRATREELKRTADAQDAAQMALNRQAEGDEAGRELPALTHLLSYSEDCRHRLKVGGSLKESERQHLHRWSERRDVLAERMDEIFSDVMSSARQRHSSRKISEST